MTKGSLKNIKGSTFFTLFTCLFISKEAPKIYLKIHVGTGHSEVDKQFFK